MHVKQHVSCQTEVIIALGIKRRLNKKSVKAKVVENEEFRFSIVGVREPLKVSRHNDMKVVLIHFSWSVCMDWILLTGRGG